MCRNGMYGPSFFFWGVSFERRTLRKRPYFCSLRGCGVLLRDSSRCAVAGLNALSVVYKGNRELRVPLIRLATARQLTTNLPVNVSSVGGQFEVRLRRLRHLNDFFFPRTETEKY